MTKEENKTSEEYAEKIMEVAYFNFPLVHPKKVVHGVINALILEHSASLIKENEELKSKVRELEGKWISVKYSCPPKDEKAFLAFLVGGQQDICVFCKKNDDEYYEDYYYKGDVTSSILYWMPLPERPTN